MYLQHLLPLRLDLPISPFVQTLHQSVQHDLPPLFLALTLAEDAGSKVLATEIEGFRFSVDLGCQSERPKADATKARGALDDGRLRIGGERCGEC